MRTVKCFGNAQADRDALRIFRLPSISPALVRCAGPPPVGKAPASHAAEACTSDDLQVRSFGGVCVEVDGTDVTFTRVGKRSTFGAARGVADPLWHAAASPTMTSNTALVLTIASPPTTRIIASDNVTGARSAARRFTTSDTPKRFKLFGQARIGRPCVIHRRRAAGSWGALPGERMSPPECPQTSPGLQRFLISARFTTVPRMARRGRGRGGTFDRPVSAHPELRHVNDGGHDAPLTPRGRLIFRAVLLGSLVLFIALLALTLHSR
jgi:hypothetical protein